MDEQRPGDGTGDADCRAKVKSFLEAGLFRGKELDLNLYQVLVLNQDATISVVDPRFSFGGSRLLAMAALRSPGADWVLTKDQTRLFVSMPESSRVAVVETLTYKVAHELELPSRPTRLALQPDEGYLWLGGTGEPSETGINIVEVRPEPRHVKHLATGRGPYAFAFTEDSRFAFIATRARERLPSSMCGRCPSSRWCGPDRPPRRLRTRPRPARCSSQTRWMGR
jgi:DNA-binding beta-propeller fold protein YncE